MLHIPDIADGLDSEELPEGSDNQLTERLEEVVMSWEKHIKKVCSKVSS